MGLCNGKSSWEAGEGEFALRDVPHGETDGHLALAVLDNSVRRCKMGCGHPVQSGEYKPGMPYKTCCRSCVLNDGRLHDPGCGGDGAREGPSRPACGRGSRCRTRDAGHLAAEAHPLDKDYAVCCASSRVQPEPLSIKVIFDWADKDGSGRLSKEELEETFGTIKALCKDQVPDITEEAWQHLDEDGNGVLNFMEFASWAGPRLGLPLGMDRMIHHTSSMGSRVPCPCNVIGCPCEAFEASGGLGSKCRACKHKREHHHAMAQVGDVPFPDYWENTSGQFNQVVDLHTAAIEEFQKLLNKTYVDKVTRDRQKHNPADPPGVPKGFRVVKVRRNENSKSWEEYGCRRAELITRLHEASAGAGAGAGAAMTLYTDLKTMTAYREIGASRADRLAPECNEWYLFHGTHPDKAKNIMENDFRVGCAGSNTGSLYGKGLYFAESITKADEYARPDAHGHYAVLFCRVLGGQVNYNDEVEPNPETLVRSCIEGPYDSVLGDREKLRGTYREFVLFDSEDVYPEYVIEYQRIFK